MRTEISPCIPVEILNISFGLLLPFLLFNVTALFLGRFLIHPASYSLSLAVSLFVDSSRIPVFIIILFSVLCFLLETSGDIQKFHLQSFTQGGKAWPHSRLSPCDHGSQVPSDGQAMTGVMEQRFRHCIFWHFTEHTISMCFSLFILSHTFSPHRAPPGLMVSIVVVTRSY